MILNATDSESQDLLRQHEKVMLMFYANWCGSCRLFKPKYEKISNKEEMAGLVFLSLNSEECPIMRKLAGVNALPFFATYLRGVLVESAATLRTERVYELAKHLSEK